MRTEMVVRHLNKGIPTRFPHKGKPTEESSHAYASSAKMMTTLLQKEILLPIARHPQGNVQQAAAAAKAQVYIQRESKDLQKETRYKAL